LEGFFFIPRLVKEGWLKSTTVRKFKGSHEKGLPFFYDHPGPNAIKLASFPRRRESIVRLSAIDFHSV